jgi:hypothetical protein
MDKIEPQPNAVESQALAELKSMQGCLLYLHPLPDDSRRRVMRWLREHLGMDEPPRAPTHIIHAHVP